ncbi:MAG TPA: hypothetical protein VFD30_12910 [Terriglobia bacterium]|nr:hypothetical protein [Terriglobia bacterium]
MEFPKKLTPDQPATGTSFLAEAKAGHANLFRTFLLKAEDYPSVEEYTDALEAEAWTMTEAIAKQSWKNGVARGQARGRKV